ncbi:MAG TPA: Na/Pi cotransporter family protein [Xanthobacteraceae bacterium]|nr:Na/Pi cotransporter family protein [Xanthobacteraceae bacterium]
MPGTELLFAFVGSVALLLWGVRMVRTGMTRAFGPALRRILATRVTGRLSAFLMGIGLTGLLQSSTATALLLASFTGRALLPLAIALAVMLGADVASTIAAQVFSLNIKWLWSVAMGIGVFMFMLSDADKMRGVARVAIGLGLMLLSLHHLGTAAGMLRQSESFASLLRGLTGEPVLGFIVGTVVTWLVHSSLSVVLLVMALAGAGALPVPLALALVLGANVGGALAPFLSLTGAPPAGRRVPLGNLAMRATVALPALFLLTPIAAGLSLIEADPGRLTINFHMAFNLVTAAIFLPLVGVVAAFAERVLPDRREAADPGKPRHLDASVVDHPSEALACAMRETLHMGDRVADMLRQALTVFEKSDPKLVKEVEKSDNAVDELHEAIKLYLVKVSKSEMSEEESRRYIEILTFTTNLEHVGDIVDKNLMELAAKKIKNRYVFSPEGLDEIRRIHARVIDNMRLAFNVFATRNVALARQLLAEKALMRSAELEAADSHFARLRQGRMESIETSSIHLDVIRDFKRINGHLTSVAYPILEVTGELADSRLRERAAETDTEPAVGGKAVAS